MFIVTLLQSVWFGRSRQKFALGSWCRRECDVGVCALCSTGIRSIYDSDVYCGVITVGVVREIVPEVCARKFVSPGAVLGRPGAPVVGIRVALCAFVAARFQFDPGGPKFVTACVSRTPASAQPQWDVIQLCLSSQRSGWLSLPSEAGMLLLVVSLLFRWAIRL